jgi:hypothetical protein
MTIPATGTAAMLNQANSFTLINPLTTLAESWIGPSSTTGIYFKGGLVGIGTTNPLGTLDVNGIGIFGTGTMSSSFIGTIKAVNPGATQTNLFLLQGGVGSAHFGFPASSSTLYITNSYDDGLITDPHSIVLTSNGNVGIGTTNPGYKLDIVGQGYASTGFVVANNQGFGAKRAGGTLQDMMLLDTGDDIQIGSSALSNDINLRSSSGNLMTVLTTGNVGIGTTSPSEMLNIQKDQNSAFTSILINNQGTSGPRGSKLILRGLGGGLQKEAQFYVEASSNIAILGSNMSNGELSLRYASNSEGIRINSTGNVGIGTTAPTAVLHLKAGTATNSTAPLKFTSGTLNTNPEAGAIEFLTDALYFTTTTGPTRKQFAFTTDLHAAVTLNSSATTGGLGLSTQEITFRAATNAQTGYATAAHILSLEAKKPFHGIVARVVGANNPLPQYLTNPVFTLRGSTTTVQYYYQGTLVTVNTDKSIILNNSTGGTQTSGTLTVGYHYKITTYVAGDNFSNVSSTLEGTVNTTGYTFTATGTTPTTWTNGSTVQRVGMPGAYFVFFNEVSGNLTLAASASFTLSSNIILATVYFNGTDYGLVNDERHSYVRDTEWHNWAHYTIGARYRSGITLTVNTGAETFSTTSGEIDDEDLQFVVNASSAFPTANAGRLFYQTSASLYNFVNTTSVTPGYLGVNNRPYYVNTTGYALTEMSSAPNRYINVFVYATTDIHTPIYFFTESVNSTIAADNGYTSLALVRAVPFPNLSGYGLSPELKPIYRLIWRADGVLQAIDLVQDDYRTVSSLPQSAGNVSTTASAVTFNPSGNISATNVQTAIEELDTEKGSGTVTSVAALTLGTTGTDLSSTVANGTTTPVITLQVPTASATNRGALSSTDWSTFNNKIGTEVDPVFAADSAAIVHWSDTALKIATQFDISGFKLNSDSTANDGYVSNFALNDTLDNYWSYQAITAADTTRWGTGGSAVTYWTKNGGDIYPTTLTDSIGIGVDDPDTPLEIMNTGGQLKLSYDGTYYTTFNTSATGDLNISPNGVRTIFGNGVQMNSWGTVGTSGLILNGSDTLVSANAVYDALAVKGDMFLASSQSVTGLKTFDKDMIAMKGTSTGVNTISVANTSATSYTNTIPAVTGTFAMGTGTTNKIAHWSGTNTLSDSPISRINDSTIFVNNVQIGDADCVSDINGDSWITSINPNGAVNWGLRIGTDGSLNLDESDGSPKVDKNYIKLTANDSITITALDITTSGSVNAKSFNATQQTLTSAATVAMDYRNGANGKITLAHNVTNFSITNLVTGAVGEVIFYQHASNHYDVTFTNTKKVATGNIDPIVSIGASAITVVSYYYDGTNLMITSNTFQ